MCLQLTPHQSKLTSFQKQTDPVPEAATQKYSESRARDCVCTPFLAMLQGEEKAGKLPVRVTKGRRIPRLDGSEHKMLPSMSPSGRKDTEKPKQNQQRTGRWMESESGGKCRAKGKLPAGSEFLGCDDG